MIEDNLAILKKSHQWAFFNQQSYCILRHNANVIKLILTGGFMNRYQELLDLVKTFETDFEKFFVKGNKAAGTRVRKHMNELKKLAQDVRNNVQALKKEEKG